MSKDLKRIVLEEILQCEIIKAMEKNPPATCGDSHSEDEAIQTILSCVEKGIRNKVSLMFRCDGCRRNAPGQLSHECLTTSSKDKFYRVGEQVLYLVNVPEIASQCAKSLKGLPPNVFETLTVKFIRKSIYQDDDD
ncbi:n-acetylglucosaminyldiphosphoundecaprenol n-acetyl-beta-d-mannosaminyltransferase [Lasius niger]|uniref:N-acetylglucosaminyldiphosphoundecaprenol n-acetyl-beta-d-mannosaminyltransferase n=1 Tax=Lasius niger TaxID=67767 RepID=A0A0J7JUD8_LASNI|nr:n-acetylglucosaminyldiphosphoundecaprenol n-acetyl-beta-d-mannosaminyltransferase [Lasius niger]